MTNFFGFLTWLSGTVGAGEVLPTRLSILAFELPRSITPTVAGLTVGAFVGVVGFVTVLLVVGRGSRRPRHAHLAADRVVFIPPYGTMPRETPLPPQAFVVPPASANVRAASPYSPQYTRPESRLPFVPSTELSARAFAKMGYDVDESIEIAAPVFVEIPMLAETPVMPAAVTVSPVVMLSRPASVPPPAPASSGRIHPLGIIKSSSSTMRPPAPEPQMMRAAPIGELAFDDSPTEIGETYFDEPPQPRRRTDPPKIRPIAPAAPRFPQPTPHLPRVTPPPTRAVQ